MVFAYLAYLFTGCGPTASGDATDPDTKDEPAPTTPTPNIVTASTAAQLIVSAWPSNHVCTLRVLGE